MKKLITTLLLIAILIISCAASADMPNFSAMSFEELQAMKMALDEEYNSRPESSEIILLPEGSYVVGKDVNPGQYYMAVGKPNNSSTYASIVIYDSEKDFLADDSGYTKGASFRDYLRFGGDPIRVDLKEGNYLIVKYLSAQLKVSPFVESELFKFEPPEGTFVPVGKYQIGKDIPAGAYTIYPGTAEGGSYNIFETVIKDDGSTELISKLSYGTTTYLYEVYPVKGNLIELNEGDVLEITDSVILSSTSQLDFN